MIEKSTQPRKQRLSQHKAPLHVQSKNLNAHLSKELRTKYARRSIRVRVGDKVKIVRGQYSGSVGAVERVEAKDGRIYVAKVEQIRKDGTKSLYPISASNVTILDLKLDDKLRAAKLSSKKK
ncbi:MAG TPA: 50S ribosomal protein L24 [Acidobacteriota bacterium]|nr:50S ribosomal protein L24 [Acidobacteriota bacterium]